MVVLLIKKAPAHRTSAYSYLPAASAEKSSAALESWSVAAAVAAALVSAAVFRAVRGEVVVFYDFALPYDIVIVVVVFVYDIIFVDNVVLVLYDMVMSVYVLVPSAVKLAVGFEFAVMAAMPMPVNGGVVAIIIAGGFKAHKLFSLSRRYLLYIMQDKE